VVAMVRVGKVTVNLGGVKRGREGRGARRRAELKKYRRDMAIVPQSIAQAVAVGTVHRILGRLHSGPPEPTGVRKRFEIIPWHLGECEIGTNTSERSEQRR
jgi:hypothetical protein